MKTKASIVSAILISVLFIHCTKKLTHSGMPATDVVKLFVQLSTSVKKPQEKKKLMQLCTGNMRLGFSEMSDETFDMSYLSNELELVNFEVIENTVLNHIANVKYRVTILNKGGTDPTKETTERRVELKKQGEAWFLSDIQAMGTDKVSFTRGMIF